MSFKERRLIRRLRDRDERAFRELVAEHRDRIYNLTYRMMGDPSEAEDLAQEVFITVFKSIDSFRGDAKFSTWLYRVAANHCKNRIKYLARRHDRDHAEYDEAAPRLAAAGAVTGPAASPRPDLELEGVERDRVLQAAIAQLEDDQRLLIVLRDIEELSYDEIYVITELPEGTVKSRLHRARLALRKKLQHYMREP
jgi:RNA polymerase sigma-70 factor (ECF subfamily)